MPAVVLYFQVHQPFRIKPYNFFSIGEDRDYFTHPDEKLTNQAILKKVANNCYLPTNQLLLDLIKKLPDFKVNFSISGMALEQFEAWAPEVIESFKQLVATGNVELLNETYYHSLSFIFDQTEFKDQVSAHQNKINQLFGQTPTSFRNTELIYSNDVAQVAQQLGFKAILAEGIDKNLAGKSANHLYKPHGTDQIKLFLRNHQLSDDIAFRFDNRQWSQWPLTADKFVTWIDQSPGDVVNLFMDYETFGEHHWKETGILDFLAAFPAQLINKQHQFLKISEACETIQAKEYADYPELTSWADKQRDLSAWISNPMQQISLQTLYSLEKDLKAKNDPNLLTDWRKLTTSDHFYYMSLKPLDDGQVHNYFSPHENAHEAFNHYMNILQDLRTRVYT